MNRAYFHVFLALAAIVAPALGACGSVPIDDSGSDARLFPAEGVIRGTVTYIGPPPCSQDGNIVGSAVILLFDSNNPPPPEGLAQTAVNFAIVTGDALFASVPRTPGPALYCPPVTTTVSASAPYTISPLAGGQYILGAFYDRTGDFLPTFKFRNLPELGDVGGGYLDLADAQKNATNPNYSPKYIPVDVGAPATAADGSPSFAIPADGFIADNVPVTLGSVLPFSRPYFYPAGAEKPASSTPTPQNPTGDPQRVPLVTMTQDLQVLAQPVNLTPQSTATYQAAFASFTLEYGVPQAETAAATDPAGPFHLAISGANSSGGIFSWWKGTSIPENPLIADMWPLVAFVKLDDATGDPQGLVAEGDATSPIVVIQGIPLNQDSLFTTTIDQVPSAPGPQSLVNHITVLVRPSVVCLDANHPERGGLLVTPHLTGKTADTGDDAPLFDPNAVKSGIVRDIQQACLPLGRYSLSAVYPSGQAWTVPNETGSCATSEGALVATPGVGSCATKPRSVLYSQGPRALLEIVPPTTPAGQALCQAMPVPSACLQNP